MSHARKLELDVEAPSRHANKDALFLTIQGTPHATIWRCLHSFFPFFTFQLQALNEAVVISVKRKASDWRLSVRPSICLSRRYCAVVNAAAGDGSGKTRPAGSVYESAQLSESRDCDVKCQSPRSPGQRGDQDIADDRRAAASQAGRKVLRACEVESEEYYEY